MSGAGELRDPWVLGGLALLVVLSLGGVLLYRSAPQSVEQVRTEAMLATRPNAFAPHLARADERLRAARAAPDDTMAMDAFSEAAESAWTARGLARTPEEQARATELWAQAMLGWAERLRQGGTGRGLRRDDNDLLRQALALVQSVLSASPPAPLRERAEALRVEIERQLRTGPLEWLPLPR